MLRTKTINPMPVPNTCFQTFVMLRTVNIYLLFTQHRCFKEISPPLTKVIC